MPPLEPGRYDTTIWRGTTAPAFVVQIKIDGGGSEWRLNIHLPDGDVLALTTEDGSLTAENVTIDGATWTRITWTRTLAQSRLISRGARASYELEQVEPGGGQGVWLEGSIEGLGGLNDD